MYTDCTFYLTTKHQKSEALLTPCKEILGAHISEFFFDTDTLGTFSGEIPRKKTSRETVREKCLISIMHSTNPYALATEASFGPHPQNPFIPSHFEQIYFVDSIRNFELCVSKIFTNTNYFMGIASTLNELIEIAEKCFFPTHGIILKEHPYEKNSVLIKDSMTYEDLHKGYHSLTTQKSNKKVIVETDMRAHRNPTRMNNIGALGYELFTRLLETCPTCHLPGWGIIEQLPGLECARCGFSTPLAKYNVYGCVSCPYKITHEIPQQAATPTVCPYCNP